MGLFTWAHRDWRTHANELLYIPMEGRFILKFLKDGGPARMVAELQRLSALGSAWASAILAFICLIPRADGGRDTAGAIELCKRHADAGDPYALYIYAWALLYGGDHSRALRTMGKAARTRFPPAAMGLAILIWNARSPSGEERYYARALKVLSFADRLGHQAAGIWRYRFYVSGKLGFVRRCWAYLIVPGAVLRYGLAVTADPFACRTFLFPTWSKGPMFRSDLRRS